MYHSLNTTQKTQEKNLLHLPIFCLPSYFFFLLMFQNLFTYVLSVFKRAYFIHSFRIDLLVKESFNISLPENVLIVPFIPWEYFPWIRYYGLIILFQHLKHDRSLPFDIYVSWWEVLSHSKMFPHRSYVISFSWLSRFFFFIFGFRSFIMIFLDIEFFGFYPIWALFSFLIL